MVVQASAHQIQVLVGEDSEDWSRQLMTFDCGYDKKSLSGLLLIKGTLTLLWTDNLPGGPTAINPQSDAGMLRWWRGNRIIINITNSTGTFVRHPYFGQLYILKEPAPPMPADGRAQITLDVGCILNLRNFDTPHEDESGVEPGVSTSRTDIINSLLTAAKCPTLTGSVPLFPLNSPIPKQSGSYVELAGTIAAGGLCSLYQDSYGAIRPVSNAIALALTPLKTITIGRDEILYDPQPGDETPVEKLKVAGNLKDTSGVYETETTLEEEYGPAQIVDPAMSGIIVTRRVKTTETPSAASLHRIEEIYAPAGLVSADAYPKSLTLILDSYIDETQYFTGIDASLTKIKKEVTRYFPAAMPEFFNTLSSGSKESVKNTLVTSELTETQYFYSDKETLQRTVATTYQPLGSIASTEAIANPTDLATAQLDEVKYKRQTASVGQRIESTSRALGLAYPDIEITGGTAAQRANYKATLLNTRYFTLTSRTGQANPPAVERAPEPYTEEEKPLEGETHFTLHPNQNANNERERTITLDPGAVSTDQLTQIGHIEGLHLIARRKGRAIQTGFDDDWFADPSPFFQVNVIEFDGNTVIYQGNALQIVHDADRALVTFEAMQIGQIAPDEDGTPTPYSPAAVNPPYLSVTTTGTDLVIPVPKNITEVIIGGVVFGGINTEYPYSTANVLEVISGGVRFGGRARETTAETETIRGGVRFGGSGREFDVEIIRGGVVFGGRNRETANDLETIRGGARFGGASIEFSSGTGGDPIDVFFAPDPLLLDDPIEAAIYNDD